MANNFKYLQTQPYTLAGSGNILGATSIILSSMLMIDRLTLVTMANFGTIGFATIEPGNAAREEQIAFTGITQNANGTATLTGVSHVLFQSPYTQTSGTTLSHPGGATLVISNTSGFYDTMVNKNDDATITGLITFPNDASTPLIGASYVAPTLDTQVATKKYVDSVAIAGAPNATTTVKGIAQLPTQAQVDAKTAVGSTGANLALTPDKQRSTLLQDYVADSGSSTAYVITPTPAATAYTAGQRFSFKATNANSTTTPTLNVSALGAKTIVKRGSAALATSDIAAGQIVEVEYDGTNMQLMSPVANAPLTLASVKFGGTGTDGALSIASGTTTIDLTNLTYFEKDYTSISITGTGALAFSNPAAAGTTIVLRSQGSVTITTSATRAIDIRSLGGGVGDGDFSPQIYTGGGVVGGPGGGGGGGAAASGTRGTDVQTGAGSGAVRGGSAGHKVPFVPIARMITPGGNGGDGGGGNGGTTGSGGRGGGALYIECAGAYNCTGTIDASGTAGTAGTGATGGGGGGGGGGGSVLVLYTTLTADSGTYTITAGAAGGSGGGTGQGGGPGGAGLSYRGVNTYFL